MVPLRTSPNNGYLLSQLNDEEYMIVVSNSLLQGKKGDMTIILRIFKRKRTR